MNSYQLRNQLWYQLENQLRTQFRQTSGNP